MPASPDPLEAVLRYHRETKHLLHRYARSLGYLDWDNQPDPFRRYEGTRTVPLLRDPPGRPMAYRELWQPASAPAEPFRLASLSDLLRHSLALSAWKQHGPARWSLRVNPSSGNLHPTEAYLVVGPGTFLGERPGLWHYRADGHVLEERCVLEKSLFHALFGPLPEGAFLVGVASVHWREAWKYGERAFRYCQHDAGHALAALRIAAALPGWRLRLLPGWSHQALAALLGLDRTQDFTEGEEEEPCFLAVAGPASAELPFPGEPAPELLEAVRRSGWQGRAATLSPDHLRWEAIDDAARATAVPPGLPGLPPWSPPPPGPTDAWADPGEPGPDARQILLQRRSCLALDGRSSTSLATFLRMLRATLPRRRAPWDALGWEPQVHLLLFVHRVEGLAPGLYLLARHEEAVGALQSAIRRDFHWERPSGVPEDLDLFLLWPGDGRRAATTVSCHQEIGGDGFFSLGMLARFEAALRDRGPWFYRNLFWETGVVGQVLYLEAEAAGARSTGIGCFFDDAVHEILKLDGESFQSLYHFTAGVPVEDPRLTTLPVYPAGVS